MSTIKTAVLAELAKTTSIITYSNFTDFYKIIGKSFNYGYDNALPGFIILYGDYNDKTSEENYYINNKKIYGKILVIKMNNKGQPIDLTLNDINDICSFFNLKSNPEFSSFDYWFILNRVKINSNNDCLNYIKIIKKELAELTIEELLSFKLIHNMHLKQLPDNINDYFLCANNISNTLIKNLFIIQGETFYNNFILFKNKKYKVSIDNLVLEIININNLIDAEIENKEHPNSLFV